MASILRLGVGSLGVVLSAVAVLGAATGTAQEQRAPEERLATSGPTGQPISIREHAGWNRYCEGIAPPVMWLDEAPRHGTVCFRAEPIKIQSMYVGTQAQCIGREVSGVRLIYLPHPGYVGSDSARYAAQYPSVRRPVSVDVTVTAGQAAKGAGVMPVTDLRQAPGPVPKCDDGVS